MLFNFAVMVAFLAQSGGPPAVTGEPVDGVKLRYIDIVRGTGAAAAPGKKYVVHYTGWLANGKKFDSSVDRGVPLDFVQGRKQVITGWDVGFEGMRVGGKRRLFIPPALGYAEKGAGANIPPNADLIFDVELLDVKDAPDVAAAVDVLAPLAELEKHVMALAKAVPEDKYGWRPAPGVRSFGEVMLHIAYSTRMIVAIAGKQPVGADLQKLVAESDSGSKQKTDKAHTLALLEESFAAARKAIEPLRSGGLGHDAELFGTQTTRRGVYTFLDTHIAEHLGQAIAYARMNGIVPPWSN
jgi:peptidylprolyl isomerase